MAASIRAPGSIFVSPLSPVIVQSQPGEFQQMLADIRPLELTNVLDVGPGVLRRFGIAQYASQPWKLAAFTGARSIPLFNMHAAMFDGWTLAAIAENPHVAAIYEDRPMKILQFPSAPPEGTFGIRTPSGVMYFTDTRWVRNIIGADTANTKGFSGQGINATIVDTGGNKTNQQLFRMTKSTVMPGNQADVIGHGTWCASAIGGTRVTDHVFTALEHTPVICEGMAPQCNLAEVKALDFVIGTAPTSMLLAGLERAVQMNSDVISCSWGGTFQGVEPQDSPFYTAVQEIVNRNIILAIAAGNSGPDASTLTDPGALPQVLTVGAYNVVGNTFNSMFGPAGEVASFSSRGPTPWGEIKPDTAMPGAIIDSAAAGIYPTQMSVSYSHVAHAQQAIAGTCLVGDTEIDTPEGPVQIKEIRPGDSVYSMMPDGEIVSAKVEALLRQGRKEVIRTETTGTSIISTPEHMVPDVYHMARTRNAYLYRWTPIRDATTLFRAHHIDTIPVREVNDLFPVDEMRFLGYFAGDGRIMTEPNVPYGRLATTKIIGRHAEGTEEVYDISVPATGNFIAAGLVLHNSMATPIAAGLLTCMRQAHKQLLGRVLTNDEVKQMLKQHGIEKNNDSGWGPITWNMYEEWLSTEYGVQL